MRPGENALSHTDPQTALKSAAPVTGDDRYRTMFDRAPVALWDQDFSQLFPYFENLRAQGVSDIRGYFADRPDELGTALSLVNIRDVNDYTVALFEAESKAELLRDISAIFLPETYEFFSEEAAALWDGHTRFERELLLKSLKGNPVITFVTVVWEGVQADRTLVGMTDISAQKASERRLETVNRVAQILTSELDLERTVQSVTDIATELTGAKFGSFFYNVTNDSGESYFLYALSGAPREAFDKFGMPRNTAVFGPTFAGQGVMRSDDIRKDPRYGKSAPHHGMPKGHLPVVSYLAVPVISRTGEVHGGLFFGHDQPRMFTEEAEKIVSAIAVHAAIAIDNGRLMQAAQRTASERQRADEAAYRLAAIVESSDDAIISKSLDSVITSWNVGAQRVFGYTAEEAVGRSITMLIPAGRENEEPEILARLRRGERVDHFETVRQAKDGRLIDLSLTISPVRNASGTIIGASKVARDITERKHAENQRELLVAELSHRVKNTLATVISVQQLSFSKAGTPEEARQSFEARIRALAQTHSRLAEESWTGVSLMTVIQDELKPYRQEDGINTRVAGVPLMLNPKASLTLGLAFHELSTNAAKYGALSVRTGKVEATWDVSADSNVNIVWRETGGPAVAAPTRIGFGRFLLERGVVSDLKGTVVLDFQPSGLVCTMTLPLDRLQPHTTSHDVI